MATKLIANAFWEKFSPKICGEIQAVFQKSSSQATITVPEAFIERFSKALESILVQSNSNELTMRSKSKTLRAFAKRVLDDY